MAIPVLGIAAISALVGRIVEAIVSLFTKKFLVIAALLGVFFTAYTTLVTSLNGLQTSLDMATTDPIIEKALMILPSNVPEMISIMVSAHIARAVFDLTRHVIAIQKV